MIVLLAMTVLIALLSIGSQIAISDIRSQASSTRLNQGFYAAEGGLNVRADKIRLKFVGYNRPEGIGPTDTNSCAIGNKGTGDMICDTIKIGSRDVTTYVQDITNPPSGQTGTVSAGEDFAGLSFLQYVYRVRSEAQLPGADNQEASVEMQLQSRLVPLFQFAAFYQDDLEIQPGAPMTLNGRVHTNANLYLNPITSLTIGGKVTAAGDIVRTGKIASPCTSANNVIIAGQTLGCVGTLSDPADPRLTPYNKNLIPRQSLLVVPTMGNLAPSAGNELWDKADLRIVATRVTSGVRFRNTYTPGTYRLSVFNTNGDRNGALSDALNSALSLGFNRTLTAKGWWDQRENIFYDIIDIDLKRILDNIGSFRNSLGQILSLSDETDGGIAIHLSVNDGDTSTNDGNTIVKKNYAFRLGTSASQLQTISNSRNVQPKGLTIASNQPIYTWGNYNSVNKIPASIIADAINVTSTAALSSMPLEVDQVPVASETTVNAAFLSGVDDTPSTGTNRSGYNGGLENYPRFHENWAGKNFNYQGSFVSLGNSLHTDGQQSKARYSPPNRNWGFDESFLDASKLPPLTPRFVYLRQLNFARSY
ncbi:hypothetical protein [uncultured Deinococcus sp.]|uniref:hypothetical protein n=1 Tax=uncultured Deinococcus sp. TaxID=158789 RepID=UPI00258C5808|nr:hypothetical protein [uncultured Deinococcus sp.]